MTDFGAYEGIRDENPEQMIPGMSTHITGDPDLLTDDEAERLQDARDAADEEDAIPDDEERAN
ncbi:hypothetical protein ACL9RL_15165 [Plantibacter sp. Mn2098]|uniref:hypothetical protein n=1 Tax=Plantibacter sp. Mn2098 TaxID=3395266 RepID=UPI003BC221FC